jgi:thiol-disulfide isomerase/thioredoxin
MSVLSIVFHSIVLWAQPDSLYSAKVEQIQDFGVFDLQSLKGQKSLWYFFQPGCESCRAQSQEFACLPKDLRILAVGVLGAKATLKKEFGRHKPRALALYGGQYWQEKLKIQKTPTLLWVNSDGTILWKSEQKTKCPQLLKEIEQKNRAINF